MFSGVTSYLNSLSNYCLTSYSNRENNNTNETLPLNIYIKDEDAITVDISKETIKSLNSDKKYYYSDSNILDLTGCDSVDQLQYINTHGFDSQNIDEFRNYIKNFHFLPLAGSLGGVGANVFANMDEVLNNLDVNDLIEIDKKLRECTNATEKLNVFSEIFGDLSSNSNISPDLREDLSELSTLFSKLAERVAEIDKNGIMQLSSDLLINLLSDKEQLEDSFTIQNKNKYKSSLISKYQK